MASGASFATPGRAEGDAVHPPPQMGSLNCVPLSRWHSGGGVKIVVSGPRFVHVVCIVRVLSLCGGNVIWLEGMLVNVSELDDPMAPTL